MLSREEKYIQEFEAILNVENQSDFAEDSIYEISEKKLKKLLKEYKRTYKQLNKIIRISDRQQEELNHKYSPLYL